MHGGLFRGRLAAPLGTRSALTINRFVVGMALTGLSRLKLRPRRRPSLLPRDLPTKRSRASDTGIATVTLTKPASPVKGCQVLAESKI
jgi:hypothetical protein